MITPRQVLDAAISEAEFMKVILQYAKIKGWRAAHFRPGMTSRTRTNERGETKPVWVTPLQGEAKGWPDLFLAHEEKRRVLAMEVKAEGGKATEEQIEWLGTLNACGIPAYVVYPSSWERIEGWLE